MLFIYLVLGVLSLTFNVHSTTEPGSSEIDSEDVADILIPIVQGPIGDEPNDLYDPLLVRRENKQSLPIFTSLKSLLSWKENDTTSWASITQIKVAIESIHQKHEALLNHIKCVFPEPPANCSGPSLHSSKWNWTLWIPSNHKPLTFFHPSSDKPLGPIAAVFIAALEHLDKKQNSIYEFLTCACEKKSNCTTKPSWHNLFNTTHWHNKINKLNPFNWHIFGTSKPHKPSSGFYSGTLIHKPILAFFNHSSQAGNQTGFIVALTAGHIPTFPTGVYGAPDGNSTESGGLGGYVSASIPTYSGSIVVGNFPQPNATSTSNSPTSNQSQTQVHSNSASNIKDVIASPTSNQLNSLQITANVTGSSSASATSVKPLTNCTHPCSQINTNSVPIPKISVNVEATTTNHNINNDNLPNKVKQEPTQ